MTKQLIIILIDDDPMNNFLSKMVITRVEPVATFYVFTECEAALDFISNTWSIFKSANLALILLDAYLPQSTGWDFLEDFEKLDDELKNQFHIVMLSASILISDKERAFNNKLDFIEKPLTVQKAKLLLEQLSARQDVDTVEASIIE